MKSSFPSLIQFKTNLRFEKESSVVEYNHCFRIPLTTHHNATVKIFFSRWKETKERSKISLIFDDLLCSSFSSSFFVFPRNTNEIKPNFLLLRLLLFRVFLAALNFLLVRSSQILCCLMNKAGIPAFQFNWNLCVRYDAILKVLPSFVGFLFFFSKAFQI